MVQAGPLATVAVYNGRPTWSPTASKLEAFVERGFVAEVRCRLDWWIGGHCTVCVMGTGLRRPLPSHRCSRCKGIGLTPAHGRLVVAEHPVTRVTVTDKVPEQYEQSRFAWWRRGGNIDTPAAELPDDVMDALPEAGAIHHFDLHSDYPTREVADTALSDALLKLANPKPPETPPC